MFRRLIGQLVAKDSHWTAKHPLMYPLVKMTTLFIIIQVLVQIMYHIAETDSDSVPDYSFPPNNHTSLFPADHTPVEVIDDGSYKRLHRLIGKVDVAMVMMYAPWCHHSAKLAKTFVDVAKTQEEEGEKKVLFVAINCWAPAGGCRHSEGASMSPKIAIYRKHVLEGFGYFGDTRHSSLLSYSRKLLRPLTHVTSQEQFDALLASHELLVVGYFNFTDKVMPPGYKEYYLASLLGLQTDYSKGSFHAWFMCVVTSGTLAGKLSLPFPPSISLFGVHRGLIQVFTPGSNPTPDNIYQWIANNCTKHKLVNQLVPSDDISHLLTTPIFLLFLPLSAQEGDQVPRTLSQYFSAAYFHKQSNNLCSDLSHLNHVLCTSPSHPLSLPLCHQDPSKLCPKYNPIYRHASPLYCRDTKEGVVTGGWPPPCTHVQTSFYYVNSNKYWALAQSMGVANAKEAGQFGIFADLTNHIQFLFPVNEETITRQQFNEMLQDVVIGRATPLYKSGCGHGNAAKCSVSEITADLLIKTLTELPAAVLLVHYVSWCAVCAQLWPVIHSVTNIYRNHTHLNILRINGDYNDIPKCHAPNHYPSLALYQDNSLHPIWFPKEQLLTVDNLLEFLHTHLHHTPLRYNDADTKGAWQWDAMGWQLWEISERERNSLEHRNIMLGEEVRQLRERISIIEEERKDDVASINLHSLIDELAKIIGNNANNNKEMSNDNEIVEDEGNARKDHTHKESVTCEADDTCYLNSPH